MAVYGLSLCPRPPANIKACLIKSSSLKPTGTVSKMLSNINKEEISRNLLQIGQSRFQRDFDFRENEIEKIFFQKSVLFIGACSFIGNEILSLIFKSRPKKIIFVDINENELAELSRKIQMNFYGEIIPNYEIKLLDLNSIFINFLITEIGSIDIMINFAAIKHVRSERDKLSIGQMLKTNVFAPYYVYDQLQKINEQIINFTISTDKAASPKSFMGASKRLLEISHNSIGYDFRSTRFANVSFSKGSLLESWLYRLANNQPLAVPTKVERFFVTPAESGQICAMSLLLETGTLSVPKKGIVKSYTLEFLVINFLNFFNLKPIFFQTLVEANNFFSCKTRDIEEYPVIVSTLNTQGEKEKEIFLGVSEESKEWIDSMWQVPINSKNFDKDYFEFFIKNLLDQNNSKEKYAEFICRFIPEFKADSNEFSLDFRA
jgi:hypothetical protein